MTKQESSAKRYEPAQARCDVPPEGDRPRLSERVPAATASRAAETGRIRRCAASAACLALLLAACGGTPVGVKRMDPTTVQRGLTRSVLSSSALSNPTQNALFQQDLTARFEDDPEGTIRALHERVASGEARRNDVFALAELAFYHAEETNDPAYHRAAAVYAWLFLFPDDDEPIDPLDPRARIAADLYNRGLARGFALGPDGEFLPRAGSYDVPFGKLDVYFDPAQLYWGHRRLVTFVPVAELSVEGLDTRHRWSGIGAPLAASTEPRDPQRGFDDFVQPWIKVSVTALLRMSDVEAQLRDGRVRAQLDLEPAVANQTVEIDGREVPLETESTASLAYMLAESPVWQREIGGFLQRIGGIEKGTQLAALSPYRPGRIPVVFVHGTASSPGRWAQMINELANDRRIGPRVQFWLFMYDTGNPIGYSAMLLRDSLQEAVARLDPEGDDAALHDMVMIGHSQGGLLAKLTAIESDDRFWRVASSRPFEELDLDREARELLRRAIFVEPVPTVTRLVFLATPHHGSYVAGSWLAQQAAKLIVLPANITRIGTELLTRNPDTLDARFKGIGTSVVNMTPGHPFIEALATTPIVPGVKAHSIIAVKDPDTPREEADDGVVEYTSAHIEDVESELVVVSGHSCQDNPHTIGEVRRIVLEHIAEYDAAHEAEAAAASATSSHAGANDSHAPVRPLATPER